MISIRGLAVAHLGSCRPLCPPWAKVEIVRVELSKLLQRLIIIDDHPLALRGDQALAAKFLHGAVHMNSRETKRIGEFLLGQRKVEAVLVRQILSNLNGCPSPTVCSLGPLPPWSGCLRSPRIGRRPPVCPPCKGEEHLPSPTLIDTRVRSQVAATVSLAIGVPAARLQRLSIQEIFVLCQQHGFEVDITTDKPADLQDNEVGFTVELDIAA